MAERTCHNCVYAVCDPGLWLRWVWAGLPIVPRCANHPSWPGQLHDVTGVPCCNYRPRPPAPTGDVRMIPLDDGFYAYVDAADYEWLSRWNWRLANGYAIRASRGRTVFMHKLIMDPPNGMVVDHIDGNKVNNCRFNLRVCTPLQNARNRRKSRCTPSQFKGVYYAKRLKKWYAKWRYKAKERKLEYLETEADAARGYDLAAVRWFGEFARLNFPREWPPQRRWDVDIEWRQAKIEERCRKLRYKKEKLKKAQEEEERKEQRRRQRRKNDIWRKCSVSKRKTHDA